MASEVISLADRLKQRRQELGLSQAQAARELDVARTAYRLWEMEAAKPSPDRWRLLSRWLGISVTTMLLAEDLVTEDEAARGSAGESIFGRTGRDWEKAAGRGDFFAQGRALVADGLASGALTSEQANELGVILERLERERQEMATTGWQSAAFRKSIPANKQAARAAREALVFVAEDIPTASLEIAHLLTSEVVTHTALRGPEMPNAVIEVHIEVERGLLRVAVSDSGPGQPDPGQPGHEADFGLTLLEALASRWGTDRIGPQTVTWFELDLPDPGA